MTRYNDQQIEEMEKQLKETKIEKLYYEKEEDYYVIELENGSEFCFRFMADLY